MKRTQSGHRDRRGVLLFEIGAAFAVLAIVMIVTTSLLAWTGPWRHALARRAWALQAAENVLERSSVIALDGLASTSWEAEAQRVARALPSGRLDVTVTPIEEEPKGQRIAVTVTWFDRANVPARPVRLTTWRFDRGSTP